MSIPGTGSRDAARLVYSAKYWHRRPQEARHGLFIVAAIILPTRDAKSARGAKNAPFHANGTDVARMQARVKAVKKP